MLASNPHVRSMRQVVVFPNNSRWLLTVVLSTLALTSLACDDSATTPPAEDIQDRDRKVTPPDDNWSVSTALSGGVGVQVDLDVSPSGTIGIAYFSASGREDGTCDALGIPDPPIQVRWTLTYAEYAGGTWNTEIVDEPLLLGQPVGLDLEFAPDGRATIAAMNGLPVAQIRFCGANDVGYFERQSAGNWTSSTVVATSGQAATGEAGSDYGDVVGYWPTLAYAPNGDVAIAYRDVHAGGMQSDDLRRADLEMAWGQGGGGWTPIPVDYGRGAGNFNSLTFDSQSIPYLAYYTPTQDIDDPQLGIWVTRSLDHGATWERVQLFASGTSEGTAVAFGPDGALNVVYYKSSKGLPELARLVDPEAFEDVATGWVRTDIGDKSFDEGYTPSIAVNADGVIAAAYYRCAKGLSGLGNCSPGEDALVFTWSKDGQTWTQEVIDQGEEGTCGSTPALAFDADGSAVVAYQCYVMVDSALMSEVRFARRDPLP